MCQPEPINAEVSPTINVGMAFTQPRQIGGAKLFL